MTKTIHHKELDNRKDLYFQMMELAKKSMSDIKKSYLGLGQSLHTIKKKSLWRLEGSHVISFAHWVENELGISKSTAYHAIAVYEEFGHILIHPDTPDIDFSKVVMLLPLLTKDTDDDAKKDLILMAAGCNIQGLKDNIRERQGKTPTDICPHEKTELWNKCKKCGHWFK